VFVKLLRSLHFVRVYFPSVSMVEDWTPLIWLNIRTLRLLLNYLMYHLYYRLPKEKVVSLNF